MQFFGITWLLIGLFYYMVDDEDRLGFEATACLIIDKPFLRSYKPFLRSYPARILRGWVDVPRVHIHDNEALNQAVSSQNCSILMAVVCDGAAQLSR